MRTFCALLLLGVVAYVQANHGCDPFAVNVEEANVNREGHDASNEKLSLKTFLANKKGVYFITHASPSNIPGSNEFCTAPTHGSECAGVEYFRAVKKGFETFNKEKLFDGVQFETTFIGYDDKDDMSIEYSMTIAGSNNDDYIFQWVEGTPITATQLVNHDPKNRKPMTIKQEILDVLKSEFALYSYKAGGYTLYVTCSGEYAWVVYNKEGTAAPQTDDQLDKAITALKAVVWDKKQVKLEVAKIRPEFPKDLSAYIKEIAAKAA